jgi:hypothetical protein
MMEVESGGVGFIALGALQCSFEFGPLSLEGFFANSTLFDVGSFVSFVVQFSVRCTF